MKAALALLVLLPLAGLAAPPATTAGANQFASGDIPPAYLPLYMAAGARFSVPWQVLAGIGRVESDHGRNPACYVPNSAGAVGPMQFLPPTFREYQWAAGTPEPDILSPHDSILAAAAMLSADGAPQDLHSAIYAYNHADWYVALVIDWAHRYGWQ